MDNQNNASLSANTEIVHLTLWRCRVHTEKLMKGVVIL